MSNKYRIKNQKCIPVPVDDLFPSAQIGITVNNENLLKLFYHAIGINEFQVVSDGIQSSDYFYNDLELCNYMLLSAHKVRTPKKLIRYFNSLDERILNFRSLIEKFRSKIFNPLRQAYDRLTAIETEYSYIGNWMHSQKEFASRCTRVISDMVELYGKGMIFLEKAEIGLNDRKVWLDGAFIRLQEGIRSGYLTDPNNVIDGLKLYLDIVEQIGAINKVFVSIVNERVKFVVYKDDRWSPGVETYNLLNCIRNVVENEILAAHLLIQESKKEESDHQYHSKYLPEGGHRDSDYYITYMDTLLDIKRDSDYISWSDIHGNDVFNIKIIE